MHQVRERECMMLIQRSQTIKYILPIAFLWSFAALAQNSNPDPSASQTLPQPSQSSATSETENEMILVCTGAILRSAPTGRTSVIVSDNNGNVALGTATSSDLKNDIVKVRLRITGKNAELFVPTGFDNSGLRKVKNLKIETNSISGYSTFWLEKLSFQIDRRTGIMTTSGYYFGGFEGICQKEDLQKRAF
jgi:hypothetical protein